MRPISRIVVPEILDSLPNDDPRARRSRLDLLRINFFMGNTRWILRKIHTLSGGNGQVAEIGAGDGHLCAKLRRAFPCRKILGLDLTERPPDLDPGVDWMRGDFFETLPPSPDGVCVGSLILHHFSGESLQELGRRLGEFRALVFCEPHRSRLSLALSDLVAPLAGEVTRHDMPASIRAGFRAGELARLLGLGEQVWNVEEQITRRGSVRFCAIRRS
jgi:hypothetical protein